MYPSRASRSHVREVLLAARLDVPYGASARRSADSRRARPLAVDRAPVEAKDRPDAVCRGLEDPNRPEHVHVGVEVEVLDEGPHVRLGGEVEPLPPGSAEPRPGADVPDVELGAGYDPFAFPFDRSSSTCAWSPARERLDDVPSR